MELKNMDEEILDYIISQLEKQEKRIAELADRVNELSNKVDSNSKELKELKR